MKKKSLIIIGAIIGAILLIGGWFIGQHNSLVALDEQCNNASASIDVAIERKYNMLTNLAESTKAYMSHESDIMTRIAEARSLISSSNMNDKAEANSLLTQAFSELRVVVENYPDLKADTVMINLMDEIAGSENRIAIARDNYNEVVTRYNRKIRQIPTNLIANSLGFTKRDLFETKDKLKTEENNGVNMGDIFSK